MTFLITHKNNQLTIAAGKDTPVITVEDLDSLVALPVGTIVIETALCQGDVWIFERVETTEAGETFLRVQHNLGYEVHPINAVNIKHPVVIQNPEILGEFTTPRTRVEDLAVGDRVVINELPRKDGRRHIGKRGTVRSLGPSHGSACDVRVDLDGEWYVNGFAFWADSVDLLTPEQLAEEKAAAEAAKKAEEDAREAELNDLPHQAVVLSATKRPHVKLIDGTWARLNHYLEASKVQRTSHLASQAVILADKEIRRDARAGKVEILHPLSNAA